MCAWDLEESPSRHPTEHIPSTAAPPGAEASDVQHPDQQQRTGGSVAVCARRPSYTTECAARGGEGGGGGGAAGAAGGVVAVGAAAKGGGPRAPCNVVALTEWGEVRVLVCGRAARAAAAAAAAPPCLCWPSRLLPLLLLLRLHVPCCTCYRRCRALLSVLTLAPVISTSQC